MFDLTELQRLCAERKQELLCEIDLAREQKDRNEKPVVKSTAYGTITRCNRDYALCTLVEDFIIKVCVDNQHPFSLLSVKALDRLLVPVCRHKR